MAPSHVVQFGSRSQMLGSHLLGSLLLGILSAAAAADSILQPIGVTIQAPLTENQSGENLINQSGLLQRYSSGTDNFDQYIAGAPEHQNRKVGKWQTDVDFVLPGNIDFDLGGTFELSAIALWNTDDRNAVDEFTLQIDSSPEFTAPVMLGTFTAEQVLTPQVFDFPATEGSYIRMTITAADGDRIRIGEAAFQVTGPTTLLGDINGDGAVNFPDFLILSARFSQSVEWEQTVILMTMALSVFRTS